MEKKIVEKIFKEHNLGKVETFQNIEIGFTNKVYLINDKFILKVCEDESNEPNFEMEAFFYDFFKDKIPVPEIKVFDKSKNLYGKFFIIYPKIEGDNLYSKWHLLNNEQRKKIIKQLCDILKVINKSPLDKFKQRFKTNFSDNWHYNILNQIQNSLKKIEKNKIISADFLKAIKKFVDENHNVLNEQKMALVYWDVHFDNILIQDTKIVGILDFERTEFVSIDFTLGVIKKMVEHPKKYMSEKMEKFAKKEDYALLLDWFQEFYPELFDFKNLDKRLDFYSLKHDLDILPDWPNSKELKQIIAKTVKYGRPTF